MKIPCVYMRGGTSKGIMFHKNDLPSDEKELHDLLLGFMGGSDPKQIDGMGGTVSSNNKIVIVSKSEREGIDIDYTIGQGVVGKPVIDFSANCGNMTSSVGPFAVDEGLVELVEPITTVRMFNTNSDKVIVETVPVKDGKRLIHGDCEIAGVDGTSAELMVNFVDPAGAKTGELFPTGHVKEFMTVDGLGEIELSIIDLSNAFVFLRAEDIGLVGTEMPGEINGNPEILEKIERIRGIVAEKLGFVSHWSEAAEKSAGSPKLVILSNVSDYENMKGEAVKADDMDVCTRIVSVGQLHKAIPLSSATAIGGSAFIQGSLIQEYLKDFNSSNEIMIGHPSGITKVSVNYERIDGSIYFNSIGTPRTARRIMDGYIYK